MARLTLTSVLSEAELLRQLVGPNASGPVGDIMKQIAATALAEAKQSAERQLNRGTDRPDSYFDKFEINLVTSPRVGIEVKNTSDHAEFIEDGTEPHDITPRGIGPLRFIASDGQWVSTYLVRHPGTRPYSILKDAVAKAIRMPFKPRF